MHSYLVLAYAGSEKAAEDVGFYYAANALGRFFGTLMSGLLYQWGGLLYSLVGSAAMLVACWLVTLALPTAGRARAAAHPAPAKPAPAPHAEVAMDRRKQPPSRALGALAQERAPAHLPRRRRRRPRKA